MAFLRGICYNKDMELFLSGHTYRYAVEQIMLMRFPEERPTIGFAAAPRSADAARGNANGRSRGGLTPPRRARRIMGSYFIF